MDNGQHTLNVPQAPSLTTPAPEPISVAKVTKTPPTFRATVLNDAPASKDKFTRDDDREIGPHSRITNAILALIKDHPGAITIGLEGYWGSGKTTIVKLLEKGLDEENAKPKPDENGTSAVQKEFKLIVFDAWAHEGDPLRRTFLETLTHQLDIWIDDKKKWKKNLEELAKRKEVQKTILPPLTRLGRIVAILAFLVPLGTAMVSGVVEKDIEFSLSPSFKPSDVTDSAFFYLGVLFTLAPLLVITEETLRRRLTRKKKTSTSKETRPGQPAALLSEISAAEPDKTDEPDESDESRDIWSMLFINRSEEQIETVTTPHPTSLEFEKYFNELLKDVLENKPKRHIVFVLDNLDRVEPDQALSIWSTLQIFMRHSQVENNDWSKRLTVLVLYDPRGIRLLWDGKRAAGNDAEQRDVTPYFLDKSFQIRFEVPSPVLSDWREYLVDLLGEAFTKKYESEFHTIYQVMSLVSAQRGEIPTIRELKLYVNQIGAFHCQREEADEEADEEANKKADKIKLSHIAYFVLLRRQGVDVIAELKSAESKIPTKQFEQLLGSDLRDSLAALAFNVKRKKARQLLLSGPINKALAAGDENTEELVDLSDYDGFWEVLDSVIQSDWLEGNTNRLPIVAASLNNSGILKDQKKADSVINMLTQSARKDGAWDLLDQVKVKGIISLGHLKPNPQLIEFILNDATRVIIAKGESGNRVDVKSWANQLRDLCGQFCQGNTPESIINLLRNDLVAERPIEDDKLSILLEILIEYGTVPCYHLLVEVVTDGHLLRHLEERERLPRCRAWCLFTLMSYWEFGVYNHHSMQRAMKYLQKPALTDDEALMKEFADLIALYSTNSRMSPEPFSRVLKTLGEPPITLPLRKACLKLLAEREKPEELFTSEVVNTYWPVISHDLRDKDLFASSLSRLIKRLIEKDQLIKTTKKTFLLEKADLYKLLITQAGSRRGELLNWCRDGLEPLTKDEWLHDSAKNHALFRLALELHNHSVDLSLGKEYVEAVSSLFFNFAAGPLKSVPEEFRQLPELVKDHRAELRDLLQKHFNNDMNNPPEKPPSIGLT